MISIASCRGLERIKKGGPEGIIETFAAVAKFWKINEFTVDHLFGDGARAVAFGRFTYTSTAIAKDDRISYMQFMEDTFATAASFQIGGSSTYHSDPPGEAITITGPPTI